MLFKKSKIIISLILVSMLVVTMLTGCSGGNGGTDTGNAGGGEVKQEYKPVTLNLNHFMSPMHQLHPNVLEPFAKDVYAKTEGRVEIVIHPSNGLAAPTDVMDSVEAGIIDIGFVLPDYTPGRFKLSSILEFPFMFESSLQANLTAKDMFDTLQKYDYKNYKLLWFGGTDIGDIFLKKPIKTVAELKGLKLRSPGPIYNDVIKELGAVEVSLPVSDLYDAMDRGIADGTFMAITALSSFKLNEVTSDIIKVNMYITPLVMAMNKNSWAKISPDDQKIIEGLLEEFPEKIGKLYDSEVDHAITAAKEKGVKFSEFPAEEMTKFHTLVDPLIASWIADMEKDGLPGEATFKLVKDSAAKYKK